MNIKKLSWWIGGGYSSELNAMIATASSLGYTLPSNAKLLVLDAFIKQLKSDGILSLLDELKVYKYNDATLQNFSTLNIKNPSICQSAVVGVNMTYGVNGWLGGTASALSTNFIPSVNGVNYTLNNAGFGHYVYNDALNANPSMGTLGSSGTGSVSRMYVRFTATSFNVNVNTVTTMNVGSNATSVGFHSGNRYNSTSQNYYINGVLKQDLSGGAASGSLSDKAMYICGYNNNGTTVVNTTQGVSMNYHGANLTSKMVAFDAAWDAYLAAI